MRSRTLSLRKNLVHGLCAGLATFLAFSSASIAARDDPEDESTGEPVELEVVVVTGTRIKRADIEGALPVTVIDREMIDRSGESSLADYVRSLSFNSHGSYRSQMGTADMGTTQVSLRGLGSNRSLILLDGRRLSKAPISTAYQDLNTIPMGAVERIEVLSDGASAIYGSDAIAGVVNIITRDDYDGWELAIGYADTDSGGGDRNYGSAMFGHSAADWRMIATFSWNTRDFTYNRDLGLPHEPEGSPFGNNFSTFHPEYGFPLWNFTAVPGGCVGSDAFLLDPYLPSLSGEACTYDGYRFEADETSVNTAGLLAKFEYDISNDWSAWLNVTLSETEALGVQPPHYQGSIWFDWPIPADSPNNPTNLASVMYDPAFGPNTPVHYWHVFESIGNRNTTVDTRLEDYLLGMTGWWGGVELDFGIRAIRSATEDHSRSAIDLIAAHLAIIDGSYHLQRPLENSQEVLDAISVTQFSWWDYDQDEVFLTAAWDLFDIGGRPVRWVLGGEYREERSASEIYFFQEDRVDADRDAWALYFESLLPLGDRLELSLAGRYDEYSDYGNDFSPKVSLRWRVVEPLMLRASWGEGFRAPELAILAQGDDLFWDYTENDPKSCEAMGEPEGCTVWFRHNRTVSPNLGAERSEQYSLGMVWEPFDTLDVVLDYYNIELTDEIKDFWGDLVLYMEQAGEPIPKGLGVVREPHSGRLLEITSGWGNHGRVETSGLDLTVNLEFGVGPGSWNSNLLLSYMLEDMWNRWDALRYAGVPDARGTLSNFYEISEFTLTWNAHYISSYDRNQQGKEDNVSSWVTHDFQVAWQTQWNGRLAIGAQNAFNERPKLIDGSYDTWLYDAFGRIVYAQYTQVF